MESIQRNQPAQKMVRLAVSCYKDDFDTSRQTYAKKKLLFSFYENRWKIVPSPFLDELAHRLRLSRRGQIGFQTKDAIYFADFLERIVGISWLIRGEASGSDRRRPPRVL